MAAIPRIYRSFAEFEREELRRLDSMHTSIDDLLDEKFAEELDFGETSTKKRRAGDDDE
jgi:hypothetical protein